MSISHFFMLAQNSRPFLYVPPFCETESVIIWISPQFWTEVLDNFSQFDWPGYKIFRLQKDY